MKKIKKMISLLLCLMLACACLSACGGNGSGEGEGGKDSSGKTEGEVDIMWWTSYATINTDFIQKMIDEFNELHDGEYHVEILYSGENQELRTKLSTTKQENLPSLITGQPIATPYYAESDVIVPIQQFIDADEEDWTSGVYNIVKEVYSDSEGNLIGWPMGVSSAGWYVNVDMVKAAGYTVDDLTSYEKIAEVATAIKNKGIATYGIAHYNTGMELYDGITLEGCDMLDNDNGYSGTATKGLLNEGETKTAVKAFLSTFAKMVKDKVAYTYGVSTDSDVMPSFIQEKIAIMGCTNSYTNKLLQYDFDFEYTFIPNTSITENGTYKGSALCEGTGTYIVDNGNEKMMQGAYELIKFLAQPENQSFWCTNTGYLPYTEEAFADADYQAWMTENLPVAVELKETLKNTPSDLRVPYTVLPDDLKDACTQMLSYLADDPSLNIDELIEEREGYLDEAIEIDALRK